jgi:hypothetical protein
MPKRFPNDMPENTVLAGTDKILNDQSGVAKWFSLTNLRAWLGFVDGPASAVDNNLASYNLTTGKIIKDSGVKVNDAGVDTASIWTAAKNVAQHALKLDKTTYNAERTLFQASAIGTDAYKITSSDVVTYVNGQTFKVQADVANTGSATLELNSLGAKELKKMDLGTFASLITGDVIANQIFFATYNQSQDCFQFSVDPANVTVPVNQALLDTTFPAGQDITAGQAVFVETSPLVNVSLV